MKRKDSHNDKINVSVSLSHDVKLSMGDTIRVKPKSRILEISNQNEAYFLHPETILYVEADGNYCDIHLTDGDVLESVGFQRAEIARKIDLQLTHELACSFSLVGRTYLINIKHIMYINAGRQQLVFDVNMPGTCKKKNVKASTEALRNLRAALDGTLPPPSVEKEKPVITNANRGFSGYLSAQVADKNCNLDALLLPQSGEKNYDIADDEVMMLGR